MSQIKFNRLEGDIDFSTVSWLFLDENPRLRDNIIRYSNTLKEKSPLVEIFLKYYVKSSPNNMDNKKQFVEHAEKYCHENKEKADRVMARVLERCNEKVKPYTQFLKAITHPAEGPYDVFLKPTVLLNCYELFGSSKVIIDVAPLANENENEAVEQETKTVLSELIHAWDISTRPQRLPQCPEFQQNPIWGYNIASYVKEIMPAVYKGIAEKTGKICGIKVDANLFEGAKKGSFYGWLGPLRDMLVEYGVESKKQTLTDLELHALENLDKWVPEIEKYWKKRGL